MSDIAIRVENLSKMYRIGTRDEQPRGLAQAARSLVASPFAYLQRMRRPPTEEETLWALRDVSFEVKHGEVLGIIGRNGAGKSTLLKILSRITEPTSGEAHVFGRVGSLLEVGTGFHPELSGRENIYLNGAILGMKRSEIDRKFDEIVDFSGVERFLDTPVKRYSSGMYVRLAFAVAAHLEPEILIIDEVLAVGDIAFQRKCLGKMGDVASEGRTVLFVSHNIVALQSLCSRATWLDNGQVVEHGPSDKIINGYLGTMMTDSDVTEQIWDELDLAPGNDTIRLRKVSVCAYNKANSTTITMQDPLAIIVEYWNLVPETVLHVTLHVYTDQGVIAFTTGSGFEPGWSGQPREIGLYRSTCYIQGNLLNSGKHIIKLLIVQDLSTVVYEHSNILSFDVVDVAERRGAWFGREPGVVMPNLEWKTDILSQDG